MALEIGIVGLPNVGKSTLFKALTKNNVLIANYPFATIEPNTGVVPVPDNRLDKLTEVFKPQKTVPATVHFTDIAGLVAGAHTGEGLGNKFLSHIRQTDAICLVVRAFMNDDITHVSGRVDPAGDIGTIKTELMLADLGTLQASKVKLVKLAKTRPELAADLLALDKLSEQLDTGHWPNEDYEFETPELRSLASNLLTLKPVIYVFNVDEPTLQDETKKTELKGLAEGSEPVFICAQLEAELSELNLDEAKELLASVGLKQPGLETLINQGYKTLGLETYFTAGEPEVRAWTIHRGSTAPVAAGKIHTDFQKGFVAAEVIDWQQLIDAGGWVEAKKLGKVRNEGKDYIVKDGDVIEFKFNL